MATCRVKRNGEEVWAMGALTIAHIEADLKRDAWFFKVGDIITIRESRKIVRRETIGPVFHGWDTTRVKASE